MERGTTPNLVIAAEDDPDIRELIADSLSMVGLRTAVANTAAEAMELALETSPSALLVDLKLPDASGIDLIARARAHTALAGIPILVVTAETRDHEISRALDAGADGWIAKPFGVLELVAAVEGLLGRAGGERARPPAPPEASREEGEA